MNKKYLMNGFAALALIASVSSCVKDVDGISPAEEAEKAKENAELQLGLNIPDGQTWEMSQQIAANVTVDLNAGETYEVAVYANDPIADGVGKVLAKGTVQNGNTYTAKFTGSKATSQLWVGVTDQNNYTRYKLASVKNGQLAIDFGTSTAAARSMRSITVNSDVYTKFPSPTEVATYFPTKIPKDADEVSDLLTLYKGTKVQTQYGEQTMHDLYAIYNYIIGTGYNLKITSAGTYDVGGCKNNDWDNAQGKAVYRYYNVYVDVPNNGEVIINRPQDSHFNLYILNGKVKMGPTQASQWSADIISVAEGATFTDGRSEVAANGGVKIFNKGTWNATNSEGYDIGNFCTFYNAGTLNVTGPLSYSPGDANTSYLVNYGSNAVLTAPSMTLNSSGNFFNSGTTTITNETNVTQSGIYWVNNGYYKTGSMVFSAGNATFFNYCQLIVEGNAHMYDGEFNLMTDSYCETNTAEFDNFKINMKNNSTLNIKGNSKWEAQGDGKYQGIEADESCTNAYVSLGGTTTVAEHMYSMMFDGNITCKIKIINDLGANNSGVQPTYGFDENVTRVDFNDAELVAPTVNECSATWNKKGEEKIEEPAPVTFAFEDQISNGDYDLNDVVLKITPHVIKTGKKITGLDYNNLDIKLVAAGATFDITVMVDETALSFNGNTEVHDAFGVNRGVMVNTGGTAKSGVQQNAAPVTCTIATPAAVKGTDANGNPTLDLSKLNIWIDVNPGKTSAAKIYYLKEKTVPYAVMIPNDWAWPKERVCIKDAYVGSKEAEDVAIDESGNTFKKNSFAVWAATLDRDDVMNGWYNFPVGGSTMKNK